MRKQECLGEGIFLTGATGIVGGLLLSRLKREFPERPVFALVRDHAAARGLGHAHLIAGDIAQPRLGMAEDAYDRVCREVGTIVHCAASTRFTLPLDEARRVNVQGTENVLELARRASRLKMLLHISSTFIAGRRCGELDERPMRDPAGWFSAYEQTKFEAEQLVEQESDVPWVIARLSTLAGHSETGHVARFNYFHQLLRLIPRNPFPMIPGAPGARVDVVADDWVGEALLAIVRRPPERGAVLHLCAGPSESMPAHEVLELAFRLHRKDRPGSRAVMPVFVSLAEFQIFVTELRKKGSEKLQRMAELLVLCLPHLEVHQDFLNGGTTAWLAESGVVPMRTREFLPRVMMSCF